MLGPFPHHETCQTHLLSNKTFLWRCLPRDNNMCSRQTKHWQHKAPEEANWDFNETQKCAAPTAATQMISHWCWLVKSHGYQTTTFGLTVIMKTLATSELKTVGHRLKLHCRLADIFPGCAVHGNGGAWRCCRIHMFLYICACLGTYTHGEPSMTCGHVSVVHSSERFTQGGKMDMAIYIMHPIPFCFVDISLKQKNSSHLQ